MNGKKGFVISSPYLVMVLYGGNVLFMCLRIKRGTEARGGEKAVAHRLQMKLQLQLFTGFGFIYLSFAADWRSLVQIPGFNSWLCRKPKGAQREPHPCCQKPGMTQHKR